MVLSTKTNRKGQIYLIIAIGLFSIIFQANISYSVTVGENEHSHENKIDYLISEKLKSQENVYATVILKDDSNIAYDNEQYDRELTYKKRSAHFNKSEEKVISILSKSEFKLDYKFKSMNAFSGYFSEGAILKLQNNPNVLFVEANRINKLGLSESVKKINVDPYVWNLGFTGNGSTVCVLDTGLDYTHPDLGNCTRPQFLAGNCVKIPAGYDFCSNSNCTSEDNDPMDINGHGTLVGGIIGSTNSTYKGVAPDSKLIAIKVCSDDGGCSTIAEAKGIDWCIDNSSLYAIKVISESNYDGLNYNSSECHSLAINATQVETAIINANNKGIFFDSISGNNGYTNGTSWPGCAKGAISVGATTDSDKIWVESSIRGTSRYSNLDLLAYGENITSTSVHWSEGEPFRTFSGTSFAAPHVAGAAALMFQKAQLLKYNLTPQEIEDTLANTGVPIDDRQYSGFYYPRIDVLAAIGNLSVVELDSDSKFVDGKVWWGRTWSQRFNLRNSTAILVQLEGKNQNDILNLSIVAPNGTELPVGTSTLVNKIEVRSTQIGVWKVKVSGLKTTLNNEGNVSKFGVGIYIAVTPPEDSGDKTGGINFSRAELSYISTCNPSNGLVAVMKGVEANSSAGDTIVNITNATIQATNAFLTGLVIPNDRIWVTMDTEPIHNEPWFRGDVSRVDPTFARTEAARVMFDADVQLKMDTLGDSQNMMQTLIYDWIENVSHDPAVVPWTHVRAWISPESIMANGTDCKLFLTNASLKVQSEVINVWLKVPGYDQQLEVFRQNLSSRWSDLAEEAERKINNNSDPSYAELRRVYSSIALAQWYKKQNRDKSVFSDLIDTNNITGLDIGFNRSHYEKLAAQHMYTFYYGNYYYSVYGGVDITNATTNLNGNISNATNSQLNGALINSYVKEGSKYYYSTLVQASRSNLMPLALGFSSLNPTPNETVNFSVAVENSGKLNSSNFTVYFYQTFTYPDGSMVRERIGETNVSPLRTGSIILVNNSWRTPVILGDYNVTAVIDYKNVVEESNELDNEISESVRVYTDYPAATILSPSANSKSCGTTTFVGSGIDPQDGGLNESRFNWSSSKDGYLGNGSSISINLSLGVHLVSLSVVDSEGFTDKSSISVNVVLCNKPIPLIISPLGNKSYAEGENIYFVGMASDEEDGQVPNSSLSWNSSIDGVVGTGSFLSNRTLSVGNQTITLKAIDETDLVGTAVVNISIKEGKPNITIASPINNQVFIHKASVSFNSTAWDPQDGDISSSLVWTSSIKGNIGVGRAFSTNLSVGTHTITATIVDSHGLSNSSSVVIKIEQPHYPDVSIISPKHTQAFIHGNNITFKGAYSDFEDAEIPNSSLVWNASIDGVIGNGTEFVKYNFSIGNHTLYFTVSDSDGMVTSAKVNITINPAIPAPSIIVPAYGAIFAQSAHIAFNGSVTDYEDGMLTGNSVNWSSNKNGFLGNGTYLNITNLSIGTHLITLSAKDNNGLTGSASINIFVVGLSKKLVNQFSDGSSIKNITYSYSANKSEYVSLPKSANVTYAAINIKGHSP